MNDEFLSLLARTAARPREPFRQLLDVFRACDGYAGADIAVWRTQHDVTASLEPLWAQCRDGRLILLVRALASQSEAIANPWRRIAVALCAEARALVPALPPDEERPLRVLEAAEAWARGDGSVAQLRATYDEHSPGLVISDGYDDPTIYDGYDHELDVATGLFEEVAPDARVHRAALRLMLEHSILCVDAIANHESGCPSFAGLNPDVPPAVFAIFCAAASAYFAHHLDLVPVSRQAAKRDRRTTVTSAAATTMGGIELERSAAVYASRARLADVLRAQVQCPALREVFGR